MKTISLLGYYGAGNLGDDLLLAQTLNLLQKIESFKFKIWVSSPIEQFGQKPNIEFINKFSLPNIFIALLESEALILGGGSLFQNASSLKSLVYYFLICFLAKILGKKLIFLSQGIGPLNSVLAKILTNWAYQIADGVSLRDKNSLQIAQSWRVSAEYAPDLVWSLPSENLENKSKTILISLRPSKQLKAENLNSFSQYLKQRFFNYQICLCAFQACDEEILEVLHKQIPNSFRLNLSQNPKQINIFEQIDFCFAMRFHAVLLAVKAGIPTIGISYDPKVQTLCQEANLPYIKPQELFEENLLKLESFQMPSSAQLIEFAKSQAKISEETNSLLLCNLLDSL